MRKENNNFNNSLELNVNGATLKLENYDPKYFKQILCLIAYITTVFGIVALATLRA